MSNSSKAIKLSTNTLVESFLNQGKSVNPVALNYPVNVRETDHKYILEISAPGFKKSDFTITLDGGLLAITAISEHEKIKEDDNYIRKDYLRSSINRAISLPEDVLLDHITAAYHDGILTIDLKKNDRFLTGKKHVKID